MAYVILGVVITVGILVVNIYRPMTPNIRAGLLGGSEGFVLVGVALLVIGWNDRRRTDRSSGR